MEDIIDRLDSVASKNCSVNGNVRRMSRQATD